MYLPVDAALGIFPQDDGFLDKPRLPADLAAQRGGSRCCCACIR